MPGVEKQGPHVAFVLPFEAEITALEAQLAALPAGDPRYAELRRRLEEREAAVYPNLGAYDTFLLAGHPLRPKALDYVRYIFRDVRLFQNPRVRGDHLVIGGHGSIEIDGRPVDVVFIGQQTGPSSNRDELLRLPAREYERWNQGMGFPDGFRKAVYCMDLAEQRGWPVVVFVDTPGADPSEFSEEEGQAFAINDVIHRTTALKTPSLAYIISQGASGGAIALTATNRTIMNEYATYMVISPGGCASILFRNRNADSVRKAAEGLRLTSRDALAQGTVDEVVAEGLHPGHRYPQELLARGKAAVVRNLAQILHLRGAAAEQARREKFFAMGRWGCSRTQRRATTLTRLIERQERSAAELRQTIADYIARHTRWDTRRDGKPLDADALRQRLEDRLCIARLTYALERGDLHRLTRLLNRRVPRLPDSQWRELRDWVLERRYGNLAGGKALNPNGPASPYRRLHPVDLLRRLADPGTFREFEETIRYCSIDQLDFPQYREALERGVRRTGLHSGLITGTAQIGGHPVVLALNNFGLVGSSLCDEIGEKFRYAAQQALQLRIPLISYAMGGGARMQEGTPSMHRNIPKVQHALNLLEEAGVPHISIIADPTLGGTAISYGLRGDYMIVVAGSANIGFSGKRVVEQFQQRPVAPDFQQGTWLLHRGFVDEVVPTDSLHKRLAALLDHVARGGRLSALQRRRPRRWKPANSVVLDAARPLSTLPDAPRPVAGNALATLDLRR